MVCFMPSVCLSIRESCQRRDCSELGTVRNWVDHCTIVVTFALALSAERLNAIISTIGGWSVNNMESKSE